MKHWSQEEIEYLRSAYAEGLSVEAVSYALGRTKSAIYMMAVREKLTDRISPWPFGATVDAQKLLKAEESRTYIIRFLRKNYPTLTARQASSILENAKRCIKRELVRCSTEPREITL